MGTARGPLPAPCALLCSWPEPTAGGGPPAPLFLDRRSGSFAVGESLLERERFPGNTYSALHLQRSDQGLINTAEDYQPVTFSSSGSSSGIGISSYGLIDGARIAVYCFHRFGGWYYAYLPCQVFAMAIMLDFLIKSCLKKLQDIIEVQATGIIKVKGDLVELQQTMSQIQRFLNDAEQRRLGEPNVKYWLRQLRDAMDYGDDIIDLVVSNGGKLLTEQTSSSSSKSTTCNDIPIFNCIPNVLNRSSVASQIRKFKDKLERIKKYGETELTLKSIAPQAEAPREKRKGTMSLVEPNLVGDTILYDCEKLVNMVLAHKEEKAYKLGIVGTGGVGKTTLAQKIYHDPKIKATFRNQQAWICVSQEYSEIDILREVLQNFGLSPEENETIAQLGSRLAAVIQNRSFFLVLDDVWKPEVWTDLLRTPLYDAKSGVIIVATRNDLVAQQIGADANHRHSVELMSAEVGWELLQKTMNMNEEQDVHNLRKIGLEVVDKCGGLPLAINVAASVLATKDRTENVWRKVLNRGAWNYDNVPAELRGALYMSYDDLPRNLKQCFLYLAFYPEDWHIFRDDVIRLWVAEGFIEQQEGQLLEEMAEEYYYELIHRNLIQPDGLFFDLARCKMHDLLRQLACYLSREANFVGDPAKMSEPRRVSVVSEKNMLVLPNTKKLRKVRTLMMRSRVPQGVDPSVFKKLLRLRVLDLTSSSIKTIPAFIDKLIHLRLLDLDGTEISSLPGTIGSLINLQILNLQRCKYMHTLPSEITQLCNLRRLGLLGTPINLVPKGICKLKFLNDIEGFPVGGGSDNAEAQDGWELKELEHLSELRHLYMIKLERAARSSAGSLLSDKWFLKKLSLECNTVQNDEPYSEEAVTNIQMIFEQIIPPVNLEDLGIDGFFGRKYPTWLGTSHLASLKHLRLVDCSSWLQLPPLGQLRNLEYLRIEGAAAVTKIGPEILGCKEAFPKLDTLVIWNMPNWEEWSSFDEGENAAATTAGGQDGITEMREGKDPATTLHLLPCLKRLEIFNCPKLRALPPQLGRQAPSLKVLQLLRASCLKAVEGLQSLSEKLQIAGCTALEEVLYLPEVRELYVDGCPKLRRVEELNHLQQLWLSDNMQDVSKHWLPELQLQRPQLHVYSWA